MQQCKPNESRPSLETGINGFVGVQQCKNCHATEYNAWSGSGHFKAMMPANDSTVAGDFNNRKLVANGVSSRF